MTGIHKEDINDPAVYAAAACLNTDVTTEYAEVLVSGLLQEWLKHHLDKNREYGNTADELGAAGQYSDMSRKMGKLKRALWDGQTLTSEQPREILMDLIGHCFLTIHYIDQGDNGR
jgi:hypothetical protein